MTPTTDCVFKCEVAAKRLSTNNRNSPDLSLQRAEVELALLLEAAVAVVEALPQNLVEEVEEVVEVDQA